MSEKRRIAGNRRHLRIADYYLDILPLLAEWSAAGVSQEDQAGRLNAMGKTNAHGFAYNQVMIGRIIRRACQLGQMPLPVTA